MSYIAFPVRRSSRDSCRSSRSLSKRVTASSRATRTALLFGAIPAAIDSKFRSIPKKIVICYDLLSGHVVATAAPSKRNGPRF